MSWKRVHLVSGCVKVADVVQGHLGGPEEVRPFRKFVDLVLANLPYHPLLLAPAERPSPPALGARARRAVGRRRGRGIFGFFGQDLDRLIRLLLRRLLEERGVDCDRRMGREPGTTSSKHSCEGATSGNPATPPESAPVTSPPTGPKSNEYRSPPGPSRTTTKKWQTPAALSPFRIGVGSRL